ncbi:Aldo/keto reductase [Gymnopus androsaceus JB14]|uniref:Aldo/keto reductase n=1 Tax=Gymnopus androsaceus JB14 TaxID=1447944 RepID=A0A6A4GT15_9AGAR|nr:Aldo/keto reductase [Gymnopus androsaceus JB14]
MFQPAPPPPTKLGVLRVLSPNAGAHVSPFCLGAMSVGDKWSGVMGSMDKESSFKLLDAYFDMGGNFIDTANNYQGESSEQFIGEWMEKRGIRDQIVVATKYTSNFKRGNDSIAQKANYTGNNTKSMHISVEASLKKLRTSYIDLLYVHWWDYDTSVKEVMDSLHTLVMQGKVLYLGYEENVKESPGLHYDARALPTLRRALSTLYRRRGTRQEGISDTPAWVVAQANEYARCMGKTPFVVYQGLWNVLDRSFERDILPMARSLGLALAPWNVLGAGKFRTDAEEQRRKESGENGRTMLSQDWQRTEAEVKVSRALEKVASEVGLGDNITAVAIAYVMYKTPYVFPIIGGRKVEHLKANLQALDIVLTEEQIQFLESVVPFDPGFPHTFFGDGTKPFFGMLNAMLYKKVQPSQPIKPTD